MGDDERKTEPWRSEASVFGYDPTSLALRDEFAGRRPPVLRCFEREGVRFGVLQGRDTVWVAAWWPQGGGLALRTVHTPGCGYRIEGTSEEDARLSLRVSSPLGSFAVRMELPDPERAIVHSTTRLTPAEDLIVGDWPHDLYVVDAKGDPLTTRGVVHASQRGTAAGLLYASVTEPQSGSFLYLQNLTSLNGYFAETQTVPDSVVNDIWPRMGYKPPCCPEHPMPRGRELVLQDSFLRLSPMIPENDRHSAHLFLDLLADLYPLLDQPATSYHDWVERAEQAVRDLSESPKCRYPNADLHYLRPYVASENPDSITQLGTLLAIEDYEKWVRHNVPFTDDLRDGVPGFYDHGLGVVRRYLPTVSADKDPEEVDSWYLYHPLTNLARLAAGGDEKARDLFLASIDFGIRVAHRFDYRWPVTFDLRTLQVKTLIRKPGEGGQTDVGGLYAYVMLQALDLTGDCRYLEEAEKAVQALEGLRFSLGYQFNNTAWGANACLRLWRHTGNERYREQGYVFLASFFHNTYLWESRLGAAEHHPTVLGVTCLHDGDYMAMYEEYEAFAAFHEYLSTCGESVPRALDVLLPEYCRHLLHRGWFYYPSELPCGALATEIRNGHLDRCLAVPVEDLYASGKPAGSVGQEIYGAGAPFAFVTRSYHRLEKAPFLLYCDYPVGAIEEDTCRASFRVRGRLSCRLRLIPQEDQALPDVQLEQAVGDETRKLTGQQTDEGHLEFTLLGGSSVALRW